MTIYYIFFLIILLLEILIGSLANGFMTIINLMELVSHGTLGSYDAILVCLGLSRFAFLNLLLIYEIFQFFPYLRTIIFTSLRQSINFLFLFLNNASLWFATWLCVFYCVRIVKINNCIFFAFKKCFDRFLPLLLLCGVVNSVIFSLPLIPTGDFTFGNWSNSSNFSTTFPLSPQYTIFYVMGSVPAFVVFCIAAWLVIYSLWKHTMRMKKQEKKPSREAHYGAVKAVGQFFVLYLVYFVPFSLVLSVGVDPYSVLECFCSMLFVSCPSMHTVLLVLQNKKLRQAFISFLQRIKCCFYQRKSIQSLST